MYRFAIPKEIDLLQNIVGWQPEIFSDFFIKKFKK